MPKILALNELIPGVGVFWAYFTPSIPGNAAARQDAVEIAPYIIDRI